MVLGREWSLKLLQFPEKRRPSPAADSFTGHPCLSLACWYSDRLMCAVPPSPLASHPARPVSSLQGEEDFTSGIWGKWSLRPVLPAPPPGKAWGHAWPLIYESPLLAVYYPAISPLVSHPAPPSSLWTPPTLAFMVSPCEFSCPCLIAHQGVEASCMVKQEQEAVKQTNIDLGPVRYIFLVGCL